MGCCKARRGRPCRRRDRDDRSRSVRRWGLAASRLGLAAWIAGLVASVVGLVGSAPAGATVEVEGIGGVGSERLAWSIGLPGGPNILSELTFQRTTVAQGGLRLRWVSESRRVAVQVEGLGGALTAGSVRDDDFAGNNRQGLFSRSLSQVSGNAVLGAGVRAELGVLRWDPAGIVGVEPWEAWLGTGWRFSQQTWRIVQGTQVVPPSGSLDSRLDSAYRARWQGPELALRSQVPLWAIELRGEVAWWPVLWYTGEGRWNLRSDLKQTPSFEHEALGWGVGTDVQVRYRWGAERRGHVGVGWRWQWMETSQGTDRVFAANGQVSEAVFNGAQRQGQHYYLTGGWQW